MSPTVDRVPPRGFPRKRSLSALVTVLLLLTTSGAHAAPATAAVTVGSKRFTESYVLGEIVRRTLADHGIAASHKAGLGNTGILVAALAAGEIDVYPEYTGTISREILKRDGDVPLADLDAALAGRGLKVGVPLGFSNTYALAMRDDEAARRHIVTLSDLGDPTKARDLKLGLSNEFLARADGWPALKTAYRLPFATPSGLDHGLAYDALAAQRVDVIDIYSTDARIGRDLGGTRVRVLIDDRHFFPAYDAVLLMRRDFDATPLAGLAGAIDARTMITLNARAELDHQAFAAIADDFVTARTTGVPLSANAPTKPSATARFVARLFGPDFAKLLAQHVVLVFGSLAAAVAVGVPLGLWCARDARAGRVVLAAVGLLQTVPSLALLALLIAALDTIGTVPALVALFLYALLPIVANTHAGLVAVPKSLVQAGAALGFTARQRLVHVELPLAAPTIIVGVRTAAVIAVGTATMAAFVGAGGFGERITAGLALNDGPTMLAGALPAAALALVVQFGFDALARLADPARHDRR